VTFVESSQRLRTITYCTCSDPGLLDSDQIGYQLSGRTISTDPKSSQSGKSPIVPVSGKVDELELDNALEYSLTKSLLPGGKGSTSAFLSF
jgi:hypothetical protein